ncbi:MAG: L-serine ammonia-lyase, iron-sulfur-dependent, subunit alpha, partial [Lachnospiraceae bacterium]|nr:L-serine ammonia-lyase, iron-sulfur-dependent, subunit alpha [Lachnospiraceae bacterium]
EKDGVLLYENDGSAPDQEDELDYDLLTVEEIYNFANEAELSDVKEVLLRQIECNVRIAEIGLKERYGAGIGKVIACRGDDARTQAVAYAAAASDARMGGCELPVVINSGSGNQGITASLPVIVYARYFRKAEEELLRALIVSNLVTLHLKSGIGRLSAYCGVVSAGVGAGAGIAYLLTKDRRVIEHEIVNAVAITSGMICDGAKPSCAAKIVMAVEAGILGFEMYEKGNQFYAGDGLVSKGVENTIHNISELGRDGMRETDKKIIQMMT